MKNEKIMNKLKKVMIFVLLICLFILILFFLKEYENKKINLFATNLEKIKVGMTLEDIVKIIGKPSRSIWAKSRNVDQFNVIKTEKVLIVEFRYIFWKTGTKFYFDESKKYVYRDFFFLNEI